jgi:peptide deformylase
MAIRPILTVPNPILKQVSKPVDAVTDETRKLMDDMLETMYAAPGIGLAAPQIGVLKRFFVVDVGKEGAKNEEEAREPLFIINPEILERSTTKSVYEEGCLSLPKQFGDVQRSDKIELRYQDRKGKKIDLTADGMLARCIQHEMDHLDGILFVDHLSSLKRRMILRRMAKVKRTNS